MQKFTEKFRLLTLISLILVAGFFAIGWLSYQSSTADMRDMLVEKNLPLTSDNVYSEIQKDILLPIYISAQMAQNTFLQDWLSAGEQDETRIVKYLNSVEKNNGMDTAFLLSEKTRKHYTSIGVFAPYLINNEETKWYFRVRDMQPDYEINTDTDSVYGNRWTIFINYRVYNRLHEFLGATGVGFTTSKLHNLLLEYQHKYNSHILLVNDAGNIVMASDKAIKVGTSIRHLEGLAQLASDIANRHIKSTKLIYQTQKLDNINEIVHVNVRYIKELKWYLVVSQNEGVETTKLKKALWLNVALSLVVILLVLAIGSLLLKSYHDKLEKMAVTDPLSGLANRQMLNILLAQTIKDAVRSPNNGEFSAIIFDIDHFKSVNDNYGHLVGNEVIQKIAQTVKTLMRESDLVARWGGEEFFVLLKNCQIDEASKIAEKIRLAVAVIRYEYPLQRTEITISLGCTEYKQNEAAESLFARIDAALYEAKNSGRNCVIIL